MADHSALSVTRTEPAEGVVVCSVVGEVDIGSVERLRAELLSAGGDGPRHLVLALSRVTFFGAVGMRVLLDVYAVQIRQRRVVRLVASRAVRRVLDVLEMEAVFVRSEDVEAAVAACRTD